MRGFTESLRQEMLIAGHKVGVTRAHPGGIKTNIVTNGRGAGATPEEIAEAGRQFQKIAFTRPEGAAKAILRGVGGTVRACSSDPTPASSTGFRASSAPATRTSSGTWDGSPAQPTGCPDRTGGRDRPARSSSAVVLYSPVKTGFSLVRKRAGADLGVGGPEHAEADAAVGLEGLFLVQAPRNRASS